MPGESNEDGHLGREQVDSIKISTNRPLITFALFAYNQEKYIREAIAGAFSQTYTPLEIILSDDCSSDRTFEIMQKMATTYRGDHRIVLNRTPQNGGLAQHINHVVPRVSGDLTVVAAGDDLSVPKRVEKLVDAWLKAGRPETVVYSDYHTIGVDGENIARAPLHRDYSDVTLESFCEHPRAMMCSYSFATTLASRFPPLRTALLNEDFVFPFRALLSGQKLVYTTEPLVNYRIGRTIGHNASISTMETIHVALKRKTELIKQMRSDLDFTECESDLARNAFDHFVNHHQWQVELAEQPSLLNKIGLLGKRVFSCPRSSMKSVRTYIRLAHPKLKSLLTKMRIS